MVRRQRVKKVPHLIRQILVLFNEVAAYVVKNACSATKRCGHRRQAARSLLFWGNQRNYECQTV